MHCNFLKKPRIHGEKGRKCSAKWTGTPHHYGAYEKEGERERAMRRCKAVFPREGRDKRNQCDLDTLFQQFAPPLLPRLKFLVLNSIIWDLKLTPNLSMPWKMCNVGNKKDAIARKH